ncbi:MAG: folylpolyglutamate synthase/dihydrofolate synthase family protein [Armatimonadota bacterium]|nr:folylpolyglutamate synthase/dihydrofolate synthase family protein [Armatimonadota bacterium]MDR7452562.1 folylpolyglutamate synthase/dihydrofolate synthase family protein [Armatimonadota bacterium]MDR7466892.1 folylpolyglutamate synthase/dihydrofolate synthase family protein [Armatimonadota bacterium]MDR7492635.1 folylpolyglutamate synthase/dihydrofolate synthase family protein [Armatimonadota bacterium]MDR7500003.1 folylpolyglutamate synthase/dihydrofolate synthase family protein [Armatimon
MPLQDALAYIEGLLTRRRPASAGDERIKLRRTGALLERLGNPHHLPTVLVAGTKGKGSTAAMMAAILQAAGYRIGLYTKPHLVDYRERFRVDGQLITPEELCDGVEAITPHVEAMAAGADGPPTYFEASVAMAFWYFRRRGVDLAIVEVGLGGRLDATNVADPLLSVITPVSFDHMDVLGTTLSSIAREKAGIIRPRGTVVSAAQAPEALAAIIDVCARQEAELIAAPALVRIEPGVATLHDQTVTVRSRRRSYGAVRLPLVGAHQQVNAATAVAAIETLAGEGYPRGPQSVAEGLAALRWPARIEVVHERPYIVVDVAHNPASLAALRQTLESLFAGRRIILVFGMIATHDHRASTSLIAPLAAAAIVTTPLHAKPLAAGVLAEEVRRYVAHVEVVEDRRAALDRALDLAGAEDVIVVTGSFFLVGEAREALHRNGRWGTRIQA